MWYKPLLLLLILLPCNLQAQILGSLLQTQGNLTLNGQGTAPGTLLQPPWTLDAPQGAAAGILLAQGGLMVFQGPGTLVSGPGGSIGLRSGQLWVQSSQGLMVSLPFAQLPPASGSFLLYQNPKELKIQALQGARPLSFKGKDWRLEEGNQLTLQEDTQRLELQITRIPGQLNLKLPPGASLLLPASGALPQNLQVHLTGPGPYPKGAFSGFALSDSPKLLAPSGPLYFDNGQGEFMVQLTSPGRSHLTLLFAPQDDFPGAVGTIELEGYYPPGQRRIELRTSSGSNIELELRKKP
ncbi:MAG: hypothetical protein RRB13_01060 [bacterium]|nr:hypothetical protein [bacterium]